MKMAATAGSGGASLDGVLEVAAAGSAGWRWRRHCFYLEPWRSRESCVFFSFNEPSHHLW
jgi:hypothetical protein